MYKGWSNGLCQIPGNIYEARTAKFWYVYNVSLFIEKTENKIFIYFTAAIALMKRIIKIYVGTKKSMQWSRK